MYDDFFWISSDQYVRMYYDPNCKFWIAIVGSESIIDNSSKIRQHLQRYHSEMPSLAEMAMHELANT